MAHTVSVDTVSRGNREDKGSRAALNHKIYRIDSKSKPAVIFAYDINLETALLQSRYMSALYPVGFKLLLLDQDKFQQF